jgi:NNP family nitrate/nitrite transporter-like MFS transporter
MAEGATFSVVPFVNKKAVETVSGIVGAGGNAGAVAAGFLFKAEGISYQQGLLFLELQ